MERIFHAALEREPSARGAFLAESCGSDPKMLADVASLLSAHELSGSFIDTPAISHSEITEAQSQPALVSGEFVGRFKIISLLGEGGMGQVYLAEDTKLARKVAIKLLHPHATEDKRAIARLLREARAAAALDHPNICPVHEIYEEGGRNCIVMQYVEGETLHRRIQREPLSIAESLDIAVQTADALSEAHSHGIVHRDVKPQNILVTPRGQVKVLDFGLAKSFLLGPAAEDAADTQSVVTGQGVIVGTVTYMSPEQAKGEPLDPRSDVFSLGAVIYECVVGQPPFGGKSLMEICAEVIRVDPPPPSQLNRRVSPELEGVILRALSKNREDRYASAGALLADLQRVRTGLTIEVTPRSLPIRRRAAHLLGRTRRLLFGTRWGKVLAAAVVVAVFAALGVRYLPRLSRAPYKTSTDAKRWYGAALVEIRDGAYYQASKDLEQAISIDDQFAPAHARLAEACNELDDADRAKDELLTARALAPARPLSAVDALYLDGITAIVRRDFAGAVVTYQKIAEQAGEEERANAYVDLGRAYEKSEETDKATGSYNRAIELDSQCTPAFLKLGIIHGRRQDIKSAQEAFDTAEKLYRKMSNFEGVVEVLYQRGYLYNQLDRVADSRALLENALSLANSMGIKYQQIRALLQLGSVYGTEGNVEQAEKHAQDALTLARANGLENLATSGLITLGATFFTRGDYAEAEKYYKQAIDVAERYKGRRNEARARLSLASLQVQQGNADQGIVSVEPALEFYRQGGYSKETSQALVLLGRAYRQKGDYGLALQTFEQQLEVAKQLGDLSQVAASHTSIGTLLGYYQERFEAALSHFEESARIDGSLEAKANLGYDLMNRGSMLWQLGLYEQAGQALDQAEAIANHPQTNNKQLMAWISLVRARLALSRQAFAAAKEKGAQAMALAGTQYKDIAVQAKYTLGLAESLSGGLRAGMPLCEEAVKMAAEIGSPRFIVGALLSQAAAALQNDPRMALENSLKAGEISARVGQKDAEWRSLALAALASRRVGDEAKAHDYAAQANARLSELQQQMSPDAYAGFLTRPDVQTNRGQIESLLARGQ